VLVGVTVCVGVGVGVAQLQFPSLEIEPEPPVITGYVVEQTVAEFSSPRGIVPPVIPSLGQQPLIV
jgi:hypothetical protein